MTRRILALAAALLCTTVAWAHYPLLEVERAYVEKGQPITIRYSMGHPYVDDRFDVEAPIQVVMWPPVGRERNLTERLEDASRTERVREYQLTYTPRKTGDYVFCFRGGLYKEMPGGRLIEDYAKVVVHVRPDQKGWDRVLGEPIEIVPLTRPYGLPVGVTFRGRVLQHGRPMLEGVVEAETFTDHLPEPLPDQTEWRRAEKTDADGEFAVTLDTPGWWMLSIATDGGPGDQGSLLPNPCQRAVLWVFVGPWSEEATLDFTAPARAYGVQIAGHPEWREEHEALERAEREEEGQEEEPRSRPTDGDEGE